MIATVEKIWADSIKQLEGAQGVRDEPRRAVRAGVRRRGQKAVMPAVQVNAWQAFDGGKAKVSPDTLGIARP